MDTSRHIGAKLTPALQQVPGLCEAAAHADQLPCQALQALGTAACQVSKQAITTLTSTPLARISGNYAGAVTGRLTANLSAADDLSTLAVKLQYTAGGDVSADIRFDPESIRAVDASCQLSSQGHLSGHLAANGVLSQTATVGQIVDGPVLNVRLDFGDLTIPVDLDRSPFAILFGDNPNILLQCHFLGAAAAAFGLWDTVVTQQLKEASPYITGKGVPLEFKDLHVDIPVKPLDLLGSTLPARLDQRALVFAQPEQPH